VLTSDAPSLKKQTTILPASIRSSAAGERNFFRYMNKLSCEYTHHCHAENPIYDIVRKTWYPAQIVMLNTRKMLSGVYTTLTLILECIKQENMDGTTYQYVKSF